MAANTVPIFALIPIVGMAKISTINTARDGSGTMSILVTGDVDGTKVTSVQIKAEVTTTAGMVRLFVSNTNGANTTANTFLIKEIVVSAITVGTSTESFDTIIGFDDLVLPSGYTLRASTEKGESFSVTARGGDYS